MVQQDLLDGEWNVTVLQYFKVAQFVKRSPETDLHWKTYES